MPNVQSSFRDPEFIRVILKEAEDFPDWEYEFFLKVEEWELTDHIMDYNPLLAKPGFLNLVKKKYFKRKAVDSQPLSSESNNNNNDEDFVTVNAEEIEIKANGQAWEPFDLTKSGKEKYDMDLTLYSHFYKLYRDQKFYSDQLRTWMLKSLGTYWKSIYYNKGEIIWE